MNPLIKDARQQYHKNLLQEGILSIDAKGIPSNADKSSRLSVEIAKRIAARLLADTHEKKVGQTLGAAFENVNVDFLINTFYLLQNLRPGEWHITKLGNRNTLKTNSFYQYSHLDYLSTLIKNNPEVASCLGNSYLIAPDIVIYREPVDDSFINTPLFLVDDSVATMSMIREKFNKFQFFMHQFPLNGQ